MKIPAIIAALTGIILAEEPPQQKLDKLVLKNGREYVGVSVTQKRPDGVSIIHESGTARLVMEDISEESVTALGGFSAEAAASFRDGLRQQQSENAHAAKVSEALAAGKIFAGRILQVDDGGVLLTSVIQDNPTKVEKKIAYKVKVGGSSALHPNARDVFETRYKTEMVERGPIAIGGPIFVECSTAGKVDGERFAGTVYPIGTHSYINLQGAKRTVKAYTTSAESYLKQLNLTK